MKKKKRVTVKRARGDEREIALAQEVSDEVWNALKPVLTKYMDRAHQAGEFDEAMGIMRAFHGILSYEVGLLEGVVAKLYVGYMAADVARRGDPDVSFNPKQAAAEVHALLHADREQAVGEGRHTAVAHGMVESGPRFETWSEGDLSARDKSKLQ